MIINAGWGLDWHRESACSVLSGVCCVEDNFNLQVFKAAIEAVEIAASRMTHHNGGWAPVVGIELIFYPAADRPLAKYSFFCVYQQSLSDYKLCTYIKVFC